MTNDRNRPNNAIEVPDVDNYIDVEDTTNADGAEDGDTDDWANGGDILAHGANPNTPRGIANALMFELNVANEVGGFIRDMVQRGDMNEGTLNEWENISTNFLNEIGVLLNTQL